MNTTYRIELERGSITTNSTRTAERYSKDGFIVTAVSYE